MHEMYNLNKVKFRISSLIKLDRNQYRAVKPYLLISNIALLKKRRYIRETCDET